MLQFIINVHNHLPTLLKWTVDFFIYVVLIRGVLANEILSELQQKGWFKKGMLHRGLERMDKWYLLARKSAILQHYKFGHEGDILECKNGRCVII